MTAAERAVLKQVVECGIEPVLIPAGFEHVRRLSWRRRSRELDHVVELLSRRGTYDVQWGVTSREATSFVWGRDGIDGDVGDAVTSGTPGSIRHPAACQSFRLDESAVGADVSAVVLGVGSDMRVVEERLRAFETRSDLRDYLLLNRDRKDRRDFVIPANLPLKLFIAAVLAVIDRDPCAPSLAAEAEQELARHHDELVVARRARLSAAIRALG